MKVEVVENPAARAAALVAEVVAAKPDAVLALPAGRTAVKLYEALDGMDLGRIRAFALDEFLEGPERFREQLKGTVYARAACPDLETEARIAAAGGLDLAILGIGVNGHIAFNEPGTAFDSRTRVVTLTGPTRRAITMGIGTILSARKIVMLAMGASKSEAVARAVNGPVGEACPASALRSHLDVTVVLDAEAASRL